MSKHYSTRWRRASGFAFAEPAVDGRGRADGRPESGLTEPAVHGGLAAGLAELQAACAEPGRIVLLTGAEHPARALICEALLSSRRSPLLTVDGSDAAHTDHASLLAAILTAYGFRVESNTRSQVMAELIAHHAGDPDQLSRRCLVVIHGAESLSVRDLQALLALVEGTALTLLLAGPGSLVATVERIARQSGLDWQEVRFGDLSVTDVRAYLQWRQAHPDAAEVMGERVSHGGPMRISEQNSRGRRRRSRPAPNPLEQLLAKVQARLEALVPAEGKALGPLGFPRRHLVALGVLVLALLVVYIIGQFAGTGRTTADPVQRVTTIATPPLPPAEGAAGAAGTGAGEEGVARPPVTRPLAVPPPATAEQPPAEPAPIIARPRAEPAASPEPAAPTAAAPPRAAPAAAPAPTAAAPSAPPAAAVSRPPASGSARSADWIMAQPGSHFTLQLVSLSSAERAQAYVAQQPDPGSFAVYRLLRNGQVFHVVVYGSYATRAEAEQAAGRLPASVGNVQPWVRQFSQVQESVRTALQQ